MKRKKSAIINDEIADLHEVTKNYKNAGIIIYEALRIEQGVPLFYKEHLNRLYTSGQLEKLNLPLFPSNLLQKIHKVISLNNFRTGNIKIYCIYDTNKVFENYNIFYDEVAYPTDKQYKYGVDAKTFNGHREKPESKTYDFALRESLTNFIKQHNINEAIMLNPDNYITEGSRSSIFFIKHRNLFTPPVSQVLPGITREKIVKIAAKGNFPVREKNIHLNQIQDFEAAFLCSTSRKILPIKTLNDHHFSLEHSLLIYLQEKYDTLIRKYIEGYNTEK